jgi:hypothetical protein
MLKSIFIRESRYVGKALFSLFLLFHLIAAVAAVLPSWSEAFRGKTHAIHPPELFASYSHLIRNEQYWGMFSSIPTFSSLDAKIEFTDSSGATHLLNPLPSGNMPISSKLRILITFVRLNGTHNDFVKPYLQQVAAEAARSLNIRPVQASLKIYERRLRKIEYVLSDGQKDSLITFVHGPYTLSLP